FVANSNLDRRDAAGSLVALDLAALDEALAAPADPGSSFGDDARCRHSAVHPGVRECDAAAFIDPALTRRLPTGAGNIIVDRPFADAPAWGSVGGVARLMVASSVGRAITWIDAEVGESGALELRCGQDLLGSCDDHHTLTHRFNDPDSTALPEDAARLRLSPSYRYAYLPHMTGSTMTLIDLRGDGGPEISDIEGDFYRTDPYAETEYAGGFAVAERPCDPAAPSELSLECSRPHLFTSHRFWPGIRQFTVATGADVLLGRNDRGFVDANPAAVDDLPYMGDLAFEDDAGERMLLVSTTPPTLIRIDTSLDDEGEPRLDPIATVSLCRDPNILALDQPPGGEALAFVSCFSDDRVAAVDLATLRVARTLELGDGPNELVIDDGRRRLYVVETLGHTIAVVDVDRTSPDYLTVIARIGGRGRFF
ncbi:MAG: hypothetical protein KC486_36070, partial [Myxococcales bacterium]|nr:hypothetical protein [Myxococcales bacterium]